MLTSYLKKTFSREKELPAADQFYSSLRVGLHTTVSIDTVDLLVASLGNGMHKEFKLPESQFSILAIGKLSTASRGDMFRFYLKDEGDQEYILLISEKKGAIEDAFLYKEVSTLAPQSEVEWNKHLSGIGFETLELDDYKYNRLWGDRYTEKVDLVEMSETIITPDSPSETCKGEYVLYGRTIEPSSSGEDLHPAALGSSRALEELLLLGVEETGNEAKITFQVGYKIDPRNITIQ